MKIDISKKIITSDNQKLSDEIIKYECIHNQISYLFMNGQTMKALAELTAMRIPTLDINTKDCILTKYEGRKVFQNDELEFGEIEIR